MTPKQLAQELHVTPLQVRNYLRKNFRKSLSRKYTRWHVTNGMADALRWHFLSQKKLPL